MAYNKKYAELGDSVIDYVNDREDRIEGAFEGLFSYVELKANTGFIFGSHEFGWPHARAYKFGNLVWLEGAVREGVQGESVCDLPAGFRPSGTLQFATGGSSTSNITVWPNGRVVVNIAPSVFHLSGIMFYVE